MHPTVTPDAAGHQSVGGLVGNAGYVDRTPATGPIAPQAVPSMRTGAVALEVVRFRTTRAVELAEEQSVRVQLVGTKVSGAAGGGLGTLESILSGMEVYRRTLNPSATGEKAVRLPCPPTGGGHDRGDRDHARPGSGPQPGNGNPQPGNRKTQGTEMAGGCA